MAHKSWTRDLLRQAAELAGRQGALGRPGNADLRRAVSAAYYALFHEFTIGVAFSVLPRAQGDLPYEYCRLLSHNKFKSACDMTLCGHRKVPARFAGLVAAAQRSALLAEVAASFIQLQQDRHEADYDHTAPFDRQRALDALDQAENSIDQLSRIPYEDDAWQAFVALVLRCRA